MKLDLNIKNKIILGSLPALILVAILTLLSYYSIASLVNDAEWVKHTHEVIANASTIEKLVVDMETGERGFLITGKKEFLEPYESGKKQLSDRLQEIKELVSDNPGQVEKLEIIEQTINQWQKNAAIPEIDKRRDVAKHSQAISNLKRLRSRTVGKDIFDNIRYESQLINSEFTRNNNSKGIIVLLETVKALLDM